MVARAVHVGDLLLGHARTRRHAAGDALGEAHDIGLHAEHLIGERLARAEDARLDLVGDEQAAHAVHELGGGLHEFPCERVHARLALDGLEHDRADLLAVALEHGAQLLDVVGGAGHEAARQRPELILQAVLHGGGHRLERAAVEAAAQADDRVAAVADALGVEARELHGALVGLGAGVGEEGLPYLLALGGRSGGRERPVIPRGDGVGDRPRPGHIVVGQLGQERRDLAAVLDVEVVGHVHEALGLGADRLREGRVPVAQAAHADPGEEIGVLAAGVIGEHHAVPADEVHLRAAEGMHHVGGFELFLHGKGHGGSFHRQGARRAAGRLGAR